MKLYYPGIDVDNINSESNLIKRDEKFSYLVHA